MVGDIDRRDSLDLLLTHIIEPKISEWGLVFIVDFPADQAALARVLTDREETLAARFEAYYQGVELANGYWEESKVTELERRFELDRLRRAQQGAASVNMILGFWLPTRGYRCAGVALGQSIADGDYGASLDRQYLSFDWLTS